MLTKFVAPKLVDTVKIQKFRELRNRAEEARASDPSTLFVWKEWKVKR